MTETKFIDQDKRKTLAFDRNKVLNHSVFDQRNEDTLTRTKVLKQKQNLKRKERH